jgi:two-component system NtrC family response regulator
MELKQGSCQKMVEKVLVVGKQQQAQQLAKAFTKNLYAADDTNDIWPLIHSVEPNLILFDNDIPHDDVHVSLKSLKDNNLNIPAVVICSEENIHLKEELLKAGAFDVLHHYEDVCRMRHVIDKLNNHISGESKFFMPDCPSSVPIVGKSSGLQKTVQMIRIVALSACNPVLIVGETGTGKELAARAVHTTRHGSNQGFVAINCAALTANLLESELFGHEKGSFTSADREKTGLLEMANEGTIFLDEISEMPIELQAKLLRVLQERTFRKVGGTKEIECTATIIASSNRNLLKEVEKGRFRRDLYYRLSVCPITIPPLRCTDRKEDIALLAEYFIRNSEICPDKQGKIKGLTKLASEALLNYHWPGNVRELRNVIERAVLLEQSDRIGTTNLLLNTDCFQDDHSNNSLTLNTPVKDFSLERAEKELVARALDESGWQKTRAAALLGITRATLYAKVKQYNIQQPTEETERSLVTS